MWFGCLSGGLCEQEWNGREIISGRPDFGAILTAEAKALGNANDLCVLACGPAPMMQSVGIETFSRSIDLHTETFEI